MFTHVFLRYVMRNHLNWTYVMMDIPICRNILFHIKLFYLFFFFYKNTRYFKIYTIEVKKALNLLNFITAT